MVFCGVCERSRHSTPRCPACHNVSHPQTKRGQGKGTYDKDLNVVLEDGLYALALPRHVGERGALSGAVVARRRAEQIRPEDDCEVRAAHLVRVLAALDPEREVLVSLPVGEGPVGEKDELVEVAHEKLERRVVWVRELVHALVQADVPQAVVLDL